MIDPAVQARQRAVFSLPVEARVPAPSGPPMSQATCPRCRRRKLAKRNMSGVCYVCHTQLSHKQRIALEAGIREFPPPKPQRRATPDTIERARARLAERGIAA
jgi:hypothetical protein